VNENLGIIPEDWNLNVNAVLDETVGYNGMPSIRLEGTAKWCNANWLPCNPLDRLVGKCKIQITESSIGDTSIYNGGRMGLSLYAQTSAGFGQLDAFPHAGAEHAATMVPWGSIGWNERGWDIIVPDTEYTSVITGGQVVPCDPVKVDTFLFWFQGLTSQDQGLIWFSDAEIYLNPDAVPDPDPSKNLRRIPEDYHLTYGTGPQIIETSDIFVRTPGTLSITIKPHVEGVDMNADREIDGTWLPVTPGDHVIANCWILVGDSGEPDPTAWEGGRLGMDFYARTSIGYTIVLSRPAWNAEHIDSVVKWGTKTWVKKTWNFIVPDTYFTEHREGEIFAPIQIDSMVLWLDVRSYTDPGNVYFADGELYIYPGTLPPLDSGKQRLYLGALGSGTTSLGIGASDHTTGSTVTVTAIPEYGCTFSHWTLSIAPLLPSHPDGATQKNSIIIGSNATISISMDESKYITAFFTGSPTVIEEPTAQISGIRVLDKSTGIWYNVYPEGETAYCTPGTGNLVIAYGVNNVGNVDGTLYGKIIGPGGVILHSGSAWVPLGGAASWEVTLDMIAQILNLTVEVGH